MAFRGGKGGFAPRMEQLTGMVKSYNRKGFGFIMCQNLEADVYFSRESLAPALQTSDLAGEYVTFECHRFPDGKLQARNLRPVGDTGLTRGPDGFGGGQFAGKGKGGSYGSGNRGAAVAMGGSREEEDRSRDWYCEGCGERNFVKRFECFKCKAARPHEVGEGPVLQQPPPPRRTLSPHAGSRAMREVFRQQAGVGKGGGGRASPSLRPSRRKTRSSSSASSKKKRRSDSSDGSSSSDSSAKRSSRRKRSRQGGKRRSESPSRTKKNKSSSSSSSASAAGSDGDIAASSSGAAAAPTNPEIEKAKATVLEKLLKLKEVEPKDTRIRDWRALLREWHPDKNPDRVEVATAVFQFLQKGKQLIDPDK